MIKLDNILLQLLGSQSSSNYSSSSIQNSLNSQFYDNALSNGTTGTFSAVLNNLNYNINNASTNIAVDNMLSGSIYNRYNTSGAYGINNSQQQGANTASSIVSLIVQKMKDKKNSDIDIETMIRDYLNDTYEDSTEVISSLSGVTNLPTEAIKMKDVLFNQIIDQLAKEVREKFYSDKSNETSSLYYSDDSTDS